MSARVWIWLLSLSVLWGGSFFFAKVALAELAPLTVVFFRVALAALALNLVLVRSGKRLVRAGAPFRSYAAMGLLNNLIPFGLIFWGQTQIASGLASILNATTPLFTLLVAHFITHDERIGGRKLGALLVGMVGVAVLMGPTAIFDSRGPSPRSPAWEPPSPMHWPVSTDGASRRWASRLSRRRPDRSPQVPC